MSELFTWRGDITKLAVQCIVNASNTSGLGCFTPGHPCIDNAIHRAAGLGLLEECKTLGGVPTGTAKITWSYNLPSKYIIHTTGPEINTKTPVEDHEMLAKCYVSCLELALQYGISEIAFCCISTGMFGYDKRRAATTAIKMVTSWLSEIYPGQPSRPKMKIIFVTFTDEDEAIYTGRKESIPITTK